MPNSNQLMQRHHQPRRTILQQNLMPTRQLKVHPNILQNTMTLLSMLRTPFSLNTHVILPILSRKNRLITQGKLKSTMHTQKNVHNIPLPKQLTHPRLLRHTPLITSVILKRMLNRRLPNRLLHVLQQNVITITKVQHIHRLTIHVIQHITKHHLHIKKTSAIT